MEESVDQMMGLADPFLFEYVETVYPNQFKMRVWRMRNPWPERRSESEKTNHWHQLTTGVAVCGQSILEPSLATWKLETCLPCWISDSWKELLGGTPFRHSSPIASHSHQSFWHLILQMLNTLKPQVPITLLVFSEEWRNETSAKRINGNSVTRNSRRCVQAFFLIFNGFDIFWVVPSCFPSDDQSAWNSFWNC